MLIILLNWLILADAQIMMVNSFKPEYLELITVAQNDPHKALTQLETIDTADFSATQKAEYFYLKSIIYGNLDYPNKMLEAAVTGLELLSKSKQPWLFNHLSLSKIDAWVRIGVGAKGLGEVEDIIEWSQENHSLQLELSGIYLLSSLYIQIEDYNKALDIIQKGYQMAPEDGVLLVKADFSFQMSAIYIYRGEFEIALPLLELTYEYQQQKNNQLGQSISLFELGRAHMELNHPEKGIKYLNQSAEISQTINDKQGIAYVNNELAYHYISTMEYNKAEELLLASLHIFEAANNRLKLFDNNLQLSHLYTKQSQLDLAESYLAKAKSYIDLDTTPYAAITVQKQQADILAANNQFKEAFGLLSAATNEQQRLEIKLSTEKLHQIRAMYEVDANNTNNELLTKQNLIQQQLLEKKQQQNIWLATLLISATIFMLLFIYFTLKFRKQNKQLHNLANFDGLTGLRNRSNTIQSIKSLLNSENLGKSACMAMVDLDHFKAINDQYGHALGDKVLIVFGGYCRELFSKNNIIGRVGGEEFILFLTHCDLIQAEQMIEKLRVKTTRMHESIKAPGLKVSFSAGICSVNDNRQTFHQLLKCADLAMYEAKNSGRNRIVIKQ